MNNKNKNGKEVQQSNKTDMRRSRKGCMKGKGGPENALCTYRGVRQRTWGKWVAEIREPNHGARLWLGTFNTSFEAAAAYDDSAKKLYGSAAKLNLQDGTGSSTSNGSVTYHDGGGATNGSEGMAVIREACGEGFWENPVLSEEGGCNNFVGLNEIEQSMNNNWDGLYVPGSF